MQKYSIQFRQGDDVSYQLTLKDSLGVAMDLTGYEVRSQIRHASVRVEFAVTYDRAAGVATLSLTSAQTSAMLAGTHRYDVELVDPSGKVKGIMGGTVVVTEEITR